VPLLPVPRAVAAAGTPAELLAALVAADPGRPRVTWYDDVPGPTGGERIELSARVLATWVAKAAGLLTDELGAERGDRLRLDLPAHWRGLYWALAGWRVGTLLEVSAGPVPGAPDILVTDRPGPTSRAGSVVAVSLPALARRLAPGALDGLPGGTLDEAADLSGQPDVFEPLDPPGADDPAWSHAGRTRTAAALVADARKLAARSGWTAGARVALVAPERSDDGPARLLDVALAAWSVDGSLVLTRRTAEGPADDPATTARWAAERVTDVAAGVSGPPPALGSE
jgi:uncharacterized protein (TIGR03089 family)